MSPYKIDIVCFKKTAAAFGQVMVCDKKIRVAHFKMHNLTIAKV